MPPARFEDARAAYERGALAEADAICRRIVAKDKRDVNAWQLLGLVANRRGWFDKSVPCFEKIVRLRPDDPMAQCQLASARMYQGRFDDARAGFDKALRLNATFPPAVRGKAELLEREGDPAAALALLEPLAARDPDAETALLAVTLLTKAGRLDDAIDTAGRWIDRAGVHTQTRRKLLFGLGRVRDRQGDHDAAFDAYRRANETGARPFDAAATEQRTQRLLEIFAPGAVDALPRAESSSQLPVFIVGMPRSGSTLVEQIIDAHPKASGVGELTAFTDLVAALPQTIDVNERYPEWIPKLPAAAAAVGRLARPYVNQLTRIARGATRVADKNLLNHVHVGLIALLLPEARVIICRRDPIENGVSCYINDLSPVGFPWSGDLAQIGVYYRCHDRLVRHWPAVLDLPILEVRYEDLVEDQDAVSRRIIDFCGLEWDDACLRFHETGRAVTTLSYDQVRQPIYRTALKRSERYTAHLGPLREALGDLV